MPHDAHALTLRPARLIRALGLCVAALHALNLAAQIERLSGRGARPWVRLVDVDAEANLPTWFSSALLSLCAASAALIALRSASLRRSWACVAALLAAMSADEVACVHERIAAAMLSSMAAHAVPRAWLWVFGAAIVGVLGATLVPFLRALTPTLRGRLTLAGATFVAGGLGLESAGQLYAARHGWANAPYVTLSAAEELLEMVGALLCLRALAYDLAGPRGAIELRAS